MSGLVDEAVSAGARVITGGSVDSDQPQFYQPTLLADVTSEMSCAKSEIFGPVAACLR